MSCTPHPQILDPCADDSVSVGQSLGAQGDVAFQEYGETALTAGDTEKEVTFDYQKESALYVFEYLYVKGSDPALDVDSDTAPDAIVAVPYSQTTRKFTVRFSGAPISADAVLVWRVAIPDPLRTICAGNGPQYAIIREEQHGTTPLVQGQDSLAVVFPEEMPDNLWGFEEFSFETVGGVPDEPFSVLGFVWTVIAHTATGFTIQLSGEPDTANYILRWQVR